MDEDDGAPVTVALQVRDLLAVDINGALSHTGLPGYAGRLSHVASVTCSTHAGQGRAGRADRQKQLGQGAEAPILVADMADQAKGE